MNIPRIFAESFAQAKLSTFNAPIQVLGSGYTGKFVVERAFVGPSMKQFLSDELTDLGMISVFIDAYKNISQSDDLKQDMQKAIFAYVE